MAITLQSAPPSGERSNSVLQRPLRKSLTFTTTATAGDTARIQLPILKFIFSVSALCHDLYDHYHWSDFQLD